MSATRTVILGAELDDRLRRRVAEALRTLGAKVQRHDWGVAGSQEVDTYEVQVGDQIVVVSAETYVGLSITGPAEIVQAIERLLSLAGE
jgi:hypothetical protein